MIAFSTTGAQGLMERFGDPALNWGKFRVSPTSAPNIQPRPPIIFGEPQENPSTQPTPTLNGLPTTGPAVIPGTPLPAVPTPGTDTVPGAAGTVALFGQAVPVWAVAVGILVLWAVLGRRR
jgi:hypothetical protein